MQRCGPQAAEGCCSGRRGLQLTCSYSLAAGSTIPCAAVPQVDVGGVLGEGGFAIVYRVTDVVREEPLALKHFRLG